MGTKKMQNSDLTINTDICNLSDYSDEDIIKTP